MTRRRWDPAALTDETLLGKYKVKALAREGGTAFVYRATHQILGGDVALKVLQRKYAENDEIRRRFLRESQLQHQLHHPHIVRVYDFVEEGGLVGCVQEWCDGGELQPSHQRDELPLAMVRGELLPLFDALALLHKRGYIHRDLKPQNILSQRYDEGRVWKLSDFGLLKDRNAETLTDPGVMLGTYQYTAPEQLQGRASIDHRADLYSLGVVLYYVFFGQLPFRAKMPQLVLQIMEQEVRFPAHTPAALESVLRQALAKQPAARFPDSQAFKVALLEALDACEQQPGACDEPTYGEEQPPPDAPQIMPPVGGELSASDSANAPALPGSLREQAQAPRGSVWGWQLGVGLVLGLALAFWAGGQMSHWRSSQEKQPPATFVPPSRATTALRDSLQLAAAQVEAIRFARRGNWGGVRYILRRICRKHKLHCASYAAWLHLTPSILRRSCRLGDSVACHWARKARQKRWSQDSFWRRAKPHYQRACRLGEARGCVALARGDARAPLAQRQRWLRRACQLRYAGGCFALGMLQLREERAPRKAQRAFEDACRLGGTEGCLALGQLLSRPGASTTQRSRARLVFARACKLHDLRGCAAR